MAYVVLDGRSGTFFGADEACLIDQDRLTAEELEDLNEGTDTDRALLAAKYGTPIDPAAKRIAELMSWSEWDADLLDEIACVLREHGYVPADI